MTQNARYGKYYKRVISRVKPSTKNQLQAIAKAKDITESDILRSIIEPCIKRRYEALTKPKVRKTKSVKKTTVDI